MFIVEISYKIIKLITKKLEHVDLAQHPLPALHMQSTN